MALKLKPEFKGVVITRNKLGIGTLTFDANQVAEDRYVNYSKLGFEDLFIEVIDEPAANEDKLEKIEKQVLDYQGIEQPKLNKKKK